MSISWSSWPPMSLRSPAIWQDPGAGDAVAFGRVAGVLEERRVDAGVPHHHRHPVEPALLRHRGAYDGPSYAPAMPEECRLDRMTMMMG